MNRQQKRALGLCYDCSELADSGRTRCTKHRKSSVAITERYRKTDKGRAVSIKLRDWARKWRWHYRRNKGRFEYVRLY